MEEFDDLFFLPEFDSNESNSNNSSPQSAHEFDLSDILVPLEGNNDNNNIRGSNSMLMSSNFFQDDFRIKSENNNIFLSVIDTPQQQHLLNPSNNTHSNKEQLDKPKEEPKKKRGRPKKVQENNNDSPSNKDKDSNNVPKKRGKPKVKKEPISSEEETIIEDSLEKSNKKTKIDLDELDTPIFEGKSSMPLLTEIPPAGSGFLFKRDQLLSMTSNDLEKYCEELKKLRPLTEVEEERFKKHNRLIRNRESAQKSRMKKRQYVDKLEKKISQLEGTISSLQSKNLQQLNEINLLKDRNLYLENLLKKAENNNETTPKFDVKKGMFIFLIVFSFGIFFNLNFFHPSRNIPNLPAPTTAPYINHFSHNRGLLSVNGEQAPAIQKQLSLPPAKQSLPSLDASKNQRTKIEIVDSSVPTKPNRYFSRKESNDLPKISPHDALVKQHSTNQLDGDSDDASYIYCSEAKRVSRGDTKSPVVGFLIPSDFLNDTNLIPHEKDKRPPLVEITCNVMEVYPIFPLTEKS